MDVNDIAIIVTWLLAVTALVRLTAALWIFRRRSLVVLWFFCLAIVLNYGRHMLSQVFEVPGIGPATWPATVGWILTGAALLAANYYTWWHGGGRK